MSSQVRVSSKSTCFHMFLSAESACELKMHVFLSVFERPCELTSACELKKHMFLRVFESTEAHEVPKSSQKFAAARKVPAH